MALSSHALTTVSEVETELGVTPGSQDALLERLINAVSDFIRTYCGRIFYYETGIVEAVAGYGLTDLVVSRTPVLSVSQITFDGDTVDASEYSIKNPEAGILFREYGWYWTAQKERAIVSEPLPGTEEKKYEVTYTAGYVTPAQAGALSRTLPYDLEDACIQLVTSRYRSIGRDPRIQSEGLLSARVTYGMNDSAAYRAVLHTLDRYAKVSQA